MSGRLQTPQAAQWRRDFGTRLRRLRVERGLSQEQLAHASSVHRTYIGSVERGEQNVSLVLIHTIADGLDVTPAALFEGEQ